MTGRGFHNMCMVPTGGGLSPCVISESLIFAKMWEAEQGADLWAAPEQTALWVGSIFSSNCWRKSKSDYFLNAKISPRTGSLSSIWSHWCTLQVSFYAIAEAFGMTEATFLRIDPDWPVPFVQARHYSLSVSVRSRSCWSEQVPRGNTDRSSLLRISDVKHFDLAIFCKKMNYFGRPWVLAGTLNHIPPRSDESEENGLKTTFRTDSSQSLGEDIVDTIFQCQITVEILPG